MTGKCRGISQTPFLIVFIILFLLTTALAYLYSTNLEKEKKRSVDIQTKADAKEEEFKLKVQELQKLADITGYFTEAGSEADPNLSKDPGLIKMDLDDVNTELDPALSVQAGELTCKRVIRELRLQRASLVNLLREAKLNHDNKESQLQEEKNTKRRIQTQQQEEMTRIRDEARKAQVRLEENIRQYERQVTDLRTSREKLANSNEQIAAEARTQAQKDLVKIKDLEARVIQLVQDEQIESTPTPDGRIIRADLDQGYAYIDLGSKDGVRAGQRFKVYAILKGGIRQEKGEVRLIRVEKDMSQCSILATSDTANPIVAGDSIWNKFFVKGRVLKFAFVGKFGGDNAQFAREQLMRVVRDAGHIASDKVNYDTHYVVLGEEATNEDEFKKAQEYKTKRLKPDDLYEFLGFGEFR